MSVALIILAGAGLLYALFYVLNRLSYFHLKKRVLDSRTWPLNICCGHTDGGGINADIVCHHPVHNFVLVENIYNLPFRDKQFEQVLCSHTIEHIEDPLAFHRELSRVAWQVTYLVPPLWDITAAFNILEHRWLFLTFRHVHQQLPRHIALPLARTYQRYFGQKVAA